MQTCSECLNVGVSPIKHLVLWLQQPSFVLEILALFILVPLMFTGPGRKKMFSAALV